MANSFTNSHEWQRRGSGYKVRDFLSSVSRFHDTFLPFHPCAYFRLIMASPSKSVFLHLVPLNEEALEILRLPANERVLGYTPDKHELALALDIDGRHRDPLVVATIGRDRTHNVVLPPFQHYARNQCSFFHNRPFGELLIEDHSGARSTSIDYLEEGLEKFRLGGPLRRRVVRYPAITRLILHNACFSLEVVLNQFVSDLKNYILNIPIPPDLEPSILPLSLPPTNKHTRTAAPKEHVPNQGICHFRIREIGRGLSGIVSETVNVVTGDHMAVKTICVREKDLDEKVIKDAAKSQIDNLEKLDHVSELTSSCQLLKVPNNLPC